ncbi:hypothetical protein LCGC14_3087100 [marine sediment metagenome]|uniref:Uncharacterized protein n=1 Tax=marine sediment metagenome TaxID=412755 RepID=A0A0F8WC89_9ZZZZ
MNSTEAADHLAKVAKGELRPTALHLPLRALANFRQAAEDFEISMHTYAMILQGKHYRAWKTYVRTGGAPDKPFRILGDIIVYAFLMYCIGVDQGAWGHEEVLEDDD